MRPIICFFLLLFALQSVAQRTHEIKTDLFLPPVIKIVHLAYEYSPNGRLGFEGGLFFSWGHDILGIPPEGYDPNTPCDCYFEVYRPRLNNGIIQISGRYYFFEKQSSAGLYGGLFLLRSFEIWREKTYDKLYEERVGEPPVPFMKENHFGIGIQVGYKWLFFKKNILLEPNMGIDYDPRRSVNQAFLGGPRVYIVPTIKLGYRFQ